MSAWCIEHPWMTFWLILAVTYFVCETTGQVFVAFANRRKDKP